MNKLYRDASVLCLIPRWICAAFCAAAYWFCCQPSFGLIGRFVVQMALSFSLSALCTAVFFFLFPRSLTVIGKGLSLFLLYALLHAMAGPIRTQMHTGFSLHWEFSFFYDRMLTVLVVWFVGYAAMLLLRLFWPAAENAGRFETDFRRFFQDSTGVFIAFYICVLIYSFYIQRAPGTDSGFNPIPFVMIREYIRTASFAYENIFYLLGNLLILFPFGFYVRVLFRRLPFAAVLFLPIIFSSAVEFTQLHFQMGHFDVDDILMNMFGFYAGWFLALLFDKVRQKMTNGSEQTIFIR